MPRRSWTNSPTCRSTRLDSTREFRNLAKGEKSACDTSSDLLAFNLPTCTILSYSELTHRRYGFDRKQIVSLVTCERSATMSEASSSGSSEQQGIQAVMQALNTLYTDPNNQAKAAANTWLQNFQQTSEAWQTANSLLLASELPLEPRLFAAQTFRTKIIFDLEQVPPPQRIALRDTLLTALSAYASGPRVIQTQLSLALSGLALQLDESQWPTVVPGMIERFGASPETVPVLLEFLTVLPEEVITNHRIPVDNDFYNTRCHFLLSAAAPEILKLLSMYVQPSGLTSQIQTGIFQCLRSWLKSGEVSAGQMADTPLFDLSFDALASDELFDVATDVVCDLINETQEVEETWTSSSVSSRVCILCDRRSQRQAMTRTRCAVSVASLCKQARPITVSSCAIRTNSSPSSRPSQSAPLIMTSISSRSPSASGICFQGHWVTPTASRKHSDSIPSTKGCSRSSFAISASLTIRCAHRARARRFPILPTLYGRYAQGLLSCPRLAAVSLEIAPSHPDHHLAVDAGDTQVARRGGAALQHACHGRQGGSTRRRSIASHHQHHPHASRPPQDQVCRTSRALEIYRMDRHASRADPCATLLHQRWSRRRRKRRHRSRSSGDELPLSGLPSSPCALPTTALRLLPLGQRQARPDDLVSISEGIAYVIAGMQPSEAPQALMQFSQPLLESLSQILNISNPGKDQLRKAADRMEQLEKMLAVFGSSFSHHLPEACSKTCEEAYSVIDRVLASHGNVFFISERACALLRRGLSFFGPSRRRV